jgi:hypothetical protein
VTLYEFREAAPQDDNWPRFRDDYEAALEHFENARADETAQLLAGWADAAAAAGGGDAATRRLLELARRSAEGDAVDPIWNLDQK